MLRIHFTGTDLARTHIAEGPDPLWETVFSLHMLRARYGRLPFAEWRREARAELRRHACADDVRQLLPLVPDASYFPDFLTPPEGLLGLEEGVEAVVATPRERISYELGILHERVGAPSWAQDLTDRSPHTRRRLGEMISGYHERALTPYWPAIRRRAAADRAVRVRALHTGGVGGAQGLLASFRPAMRWRPPVLEIPTHPVDRELHLAGRGLLLVPSQFLWHRPVPLADPELPPTLLYPLDRDPRWMSAGSYGTGEPAASGDALARLLGGTRAAVLRATATVPNTTELARRAGISPSAASQHAAVLRDAGLIVSHRHANSVFHQLSPAGGALLRRRTEGDADR
ncbi:ArsR/SmtB family transcription factor [Streptomyces winkii]|uniref:ArsR/SmtB family transcription factor n=1 Tax=Streptomyces winkii TaxID=3051178 RepID=UPI0028D55209|nr:winged helix-turn-helix domain-containing protein [Streptomyces sp. DSM 40971]